MTQIFREILGRPIGKETKFLKWEDVIFQFKKESSKIKLLTNEDKTKVAFRVETSNGINAEVEISADELKNLIKTSTEQLAKIEKQ